MSMHNVLVRTVLFFAFLCLPFLGYAADKSPTGGERFMDQVRKNFAEWDAN